MKAILLTLFLLSSTYAFGSVIPSQPKCEIQAEVIDIDGNWRPGTKTFEIKIDQVTTIDAQNGFDACANLYTRGQIITADVNPRKSYVNKKIRIKAGNQIVGQIQYAPAEWSTKYFLTQINLLKNTK